MITIQDNDLTVQIDELGAQLHSIQFDGKEYLWQGDQASWKRQAPILFPFVGRLKDDQYSYQGTTFHQTQHGFARDQRFAVENQQTDQVTMVLHDSQTTRAVYPFQFELEVTYQVTAGQLKISYVVTNPSQDQTLIYALGAHPGFNVPLEPTDEFSNQTVTVDPAKTYSRIKLVSPGPLNDLEHPQQINLSQPLRLNHELFNEDALIIDPAAQPVTVTVSDSQGQHGVKVITTDNKLIGIWSPYPAQANLLCIEPWWGIADGIHSDGQLIHKQLMDRLQPSEQKQYGFSIQPF